MLILNKKKGPTTLSQNVALLNHPGVLPGRSCCSARKRMRRGNAFMESWWIAIMEAAVVAVEFGSKRRFGGGFWHMAGATRKTWR